MLSQGVKAISGARQSDVVEGNNVAFDKARQR
jgi:hypothetical protein